MKTLIAVLFAGLIVSQMQINTLRGELDSADVNARNALNKVAEVKDHVQWLERNR